MKQQIALSTILTISTLAIMPVTALAVSLPMRAKVASPAAREQKIEARVEQKAANQAERMAQIKEKAVKEIDRRTTSLNTLTAKISSSPKMSAADKASLSAVVSSDITNLTTLKAKIQADADAATLKVDVQAVVKDYRVYALLMPQVALLNASDRLMVVADKLSSVSASLATKIDLAAKNGQDVTSLQTTLTDLNTKVSEAKRLAQSVHDSVMPLVPEGYPGNRPTLLAAKTSLQTAKQDLVKASQDAKEIEQLLRSGKKASKAATPSTLAK